MRSKRFFCKKRHLWAFLGDWPLPKPNAAEGLATNVIVTVPVCGTGTLVNVNFNAQLAQMLVLELVWEQLLWFNKLLGRNEIPSPAKHHFNNHIGSKLHTGPNKRITPPPCGAKLRPCTGMRGSTPYPHGCKMNGGPGAGGRAPVAVRSSRPTCDVPQSKRERITGQNERYVGNDLLLCCVF